MAQQKPTDNSALSDEELAALYFDHGDMALLGDLYLRYTDMLYAVCYKYLEDRELAKDASMDLFEELRVKLRKHRISYFRAWLYRVARNHCLMHLRTTKHLPTAGFDPDRVYLVEEMHLIDVHEKELKLNEMEKCLEKLPEDQQNAIKLFYLKDMSYQEISISTQVELNKVRSHIQNGRRNLKICMETEMDENPKAG